MAGGVPFGVPIGNIGPRSGADFSPYFEMWRLRQQQQQAAQDQALRQQQLGAQQSTAAAELEAQKAYQTGLLAQRERESMLDSEQAKANLLQRKEEMKADVGFRNRKLDMDKAAADRKAQELEALRAKADREAADAKAAEDAEQKRAEQSRDVYTRAKAIIPDAVARLRASMPSVGAGVEQSLEEIRDIMIDDAGKLQGDDRAAVLKAIDEWYETESEARKDTADIEARRESTKSLKASREASARADARSAEMKADSDEFKRMESKLEALQRALGLAKFDNNQEEAADIQEQIDELMAVMYG